jgi:ribonucleoside-diphosphate reductase alpha chain
MSNWQWEQEISKEIFFRKYGLHGEKTVEEVFRGVAAEIASKEKDPKKWEEIFYKELSEGRLIPAGRILANARLDSPMKNYNNCFTIDIEDSMESIYNSLAEDASISKVGGGVGFDVSKLRPKGAPLSKGGESSGVISFLRIFDQSARTIMTGGQRRAAHIALLDISHPEIEDFINAKKGDVNKELTQFNISVKVTDAFIEAVKKDADWDLVFEGKVYKTVKAKDLYNKLAKNAYFNNEPGIFYADTVNKYNNGWWAFDMDRVNPCGELVMPSYSLCCLSAINLTKFVKHPFTDGAYFDSVDFMTTIYIAVRFLDNVLDVTEYPLKKIEDFSKQWRRIGLGFTGLGDVFAMMKIPYGSKQSLDVAEMIAVTLRNITYCASADLAEEKGSFPAYDAEKYLEGEFIKQLPDWVRETIKYQGMRNVQLNTIAPTGTTSLSIGQNCSSGIEPIFSLSYERTIRTNTEEETKKEKVSDYAWKMYTEMFPGKDKPDYFTTTMDIDPYASIDVQATFQKYIDHSISKTLNLPPGTSYEEYQKIFMYAYDKGLKGFTTFNPEGSMKGILEYNDTKKTVTRRVAPERPVELPCEVHKLKMGKGYLLVIVGLLNGSLYELFTIPMSKEVFFLESIADLSIKKAAKGQYDIVFDNGEVLVRNFTKRYTSEEASLTRMLSMALRHGTPLQFIVSQLQKDTAFNSVERSIARVLKEYIKDGEEVITSEGHCPECDGKLVFRDGCMTCIDCGHSKCS